MEKTNPLNRLTLENVIQLFDFTNVFIYKNNFFHENQRNEFQNGTAKLKVFFTINIV